ncbi:MAG: hypothetical protein ACTHJH_16485 [Marmoricola sp.]
MTAVRPIVDADPAPAPGAPTRHRRTPLAAWLVLPAGLAMLAGLDAALVLLGVAAPVHTGRLAGAHGLVMTLGFVGALIALERGVALAHPAGLISPVALAAGALALLTPLPHAAGSLLLVLGAAALVGTYVPLWRRQRDDAVLVQAGAAVLALGAAVLAAGGVGMPAVVPWLVGFLVLTIAGERLELARVAVGPGAGPTLLALGGLTTLSTLAALLWPDAGTPILGAAYLLLTAWLVRHDVARRTVRSTGLTRFMAAGMLAGYAWLAVAGGTWFLHGPATDGPAYDAVVHAVFLGFTLSMVMAHAPVILPAVLRRPLPWHPVLWAPLALLHVGVVVRLWLGDARGLHAVWQVGGVLDVVALLLFAATVIALVTRAGGRR